MIPLNNYYIYIYIYSFTQHMVYSTFNIKLQPMQTSILYVHKLYYRYILYSHGQALAINNYCPLTHTSCYLYNMKGQLIITSYQIVTDCRHTAYTNPHFSYCTRSLSQTLILQLLKKPTRTAQHQQSHV